MDKGTENIYLQVFFTGDEDSYIYACSTRNQRIEAYWSRLKKFRLNWWINFFSNMVENGLFRPQMSTHQECLLFCFLPILQVELNLFLKTWNTRQVRQSAAAPGGKPDMLFHVPSSIGYTCQGIEVDSNIYK